MNYLKSFFYSSKKEKKDLRNEKNYRRIKNYLMKNTSTIADDYNMRLKLERLFYNDIDWLRLLAHLINHSQRLEAR